LANKEVFTATAKPHVQEKGYKYALVEKMPEQWGLGDSVADFQEKGYEIMQDGPRRVMMRMPLDEFKQIESGVMKVAEDRLRSTDGLGKIKQQDISGKQMVDALPDVSDLDE